MNEIDTELPIDVVSNVGQETFDMTVTVLTIFSIELLNRGIDGLQVAEALSATVENVTESGSASIIQMIHDKVTGAHDKVVGAQEDG